MANSNQLLCLPCSFSELDKSSHFLLNKIRFQPQKEFLPFPEWFPYRTVTLPNSRPKIFLRILWVRRWGQERVDHWAKAPRLVRGSAGAPSPGQRTQSPSSQLVKTTRNYFICAILGRGLGRCILN